MNILNASIKNIDEIMNLLSDSIKKMNLEGSFQWDSNYPNKLIITNDIKNKDLFILEDNNKILGIIVLNSNQAEEYKNLCWKYNNKKTLVIHRMAINPKNQGNGFSKMLMKFAENFAKKNKYKVIRTDTYIENIKMQNLFKKLSYEKAGEVFFNNGKLKPFICYEKLIK